MTGALSGEAAKHAVKRSRTDLSFVILAWNSGRYLSKCFDSIKLKCAAEGIAYEVIIIDNGSTDGSKEIIERYAAESRGGFKLIALQRNMGTTYPRNLGLRLAQGSHICILDSDTQLRDGSLKAVLDALDAHKQIGLIAPRLFLEDGTVQHSVKKFPSFWQKLIKIPKAVLGLRVPDVDFYAGFPFDTATDVDSAISACWFLRRELLDEIGFLDERIFYAPEDLDYCLRTRRAGKRIVYHPGLNVLHHTQQISHRSPLSKIALSHFRGLIYYFLKHGGWICRPNVG